MHNNLDNTLYLFNGEKFKRSTVGYSKKSGQRDLYVPELLTLPSTHEPLSKAPPFDDHYASSLIMKALHICLMNLVSYIITPISLIPLSNSTSHPKSIVKAWYVATHYASELSKSFPANGKFYKDPMKLIHLWKLEDQYSLLINHDFEHPFPCSFWGRNFTIRRRTDKEFFLHDQTGFKGVAVLPEDCLKLMAILTIRDHYAYYLRKEIISHL